MNITPIYTLNFFFVQEYFIHKEMSSLALMGCKAYAYGRISCYDTGPRLYIRATENVCAENG